MNRAFRQYASPRSELPITDYTEDLDVLTFTDFYPLLIVSV